VSLQRRQGISSCQRTIGSYGLDALVGDLLITKRPVDVKVWVNQRLAAKIQLAAADPVTRYIPAGDGGNRLMLEIRVSRVDRPRDRGQDDPRDVGLLMRWDFVDAPPHNGVIENIL
jgi:hypothetical protein